MASRRKSETNARVVNNIIINTYPFNPSFTSEIFTEDVSNW